MERQRLLAYRRARLEAEEQVTSFLDNRREQERQRLEAEEKVLPFRAQSTRIGRGGDRVNKASCMSVRRCSAQQEHPASVHAASSRVVLYVTQHQSQVRAKNDSGYLSTSLSTQTVHTSATHSPD